MPSLRRLNRRLARWHRYFGRYRHVPFGPIETDKVGTPDAPISWGRFNDQRSYWRLRGDINVERERRGLDRPDDDDFHRPGYEEDGSIYPALMPTEFGWLE